MLAERSRSIEKFHQKAFCLGNRYGHSRGSTLIIKALPRIFTGTTYVAVMQLPVCSHMKHDDTSVVLQWARFSYLGSWDASRRWYISSAKL